LRLAKIFATVMLLLVPFLGATSFVTLVVDGVENPPTMNQGDMLFLRMDCGEGNTVLLELFIDADASGTVSDGDFLLFEVPVADNDTIVIPDLDPTPGMIYTTSGPLGLAPLPYVFRITDEDDSWAEAGIIIMPHPDPPAVITGHVHIDGVLAPSPLLSMIWIENMGFPMVSAITDEMGYFELNMLTESGTDMFRVRRDVPPYITPEPREFTWDGDFHGLDFRYTLGHSYVYGDIVTVDDEPITLPVHIFLVNQMTGVRTEFLAEDGSYMFTDVSPGEYRIDVTTADLIPEYMTELYWDDPYFRFTVSAGDSIRKNLTCFPTDTMITADVFIDGAPAPNYWLFGFNYTMGFTKAETGAEGSTELACAVGDGSAYRVRIGRELSPPPAGYVIEGANYLWDEPVGSHLEFNIISSFGAIVGEMLSDPDITELDDYHLHRITFYSLPETTFVTHITNPYSLSYECFLSPGEYMAVVSERPFMRPAPAMVKPSGISSVSLAHGDTTRVDFQYNKKHCDVFVHIEGADPDSIREVAVIAQGDGVWPDCYFVRAKFADGETSVSFEVCDAEWLFTAPEIPGFTPTTPETTIIIDEEQTLLHLTFEYNITGIVEGALPSAVSLAPNYPNPFNAATSIEFTVHSSQNVRVDVFDISGRAMRNLHDGEVSAGAHKLLWDGTTDAGELAGSGVYMLRLTAGDSVLQRKMLLIK